MLGKILNWKSMTAAFAVLALMALAAGAVYAKRGGVGADVINEFNCRINLAALGGGDIFTTKSHSVTTPSGKTVLKCTGVIPAELIPSKTVQDKGFLCITYLGATNNSRKVFTPSGKALLTCQINGKK